MCFLVCFCIFICCIIIIMTRHCTKTCSTVCLEPENIIRTCSHCSHASPDICIYIYIVFLFFGGGTCLQPSPGACCASAESLRYTFHGEVTDWNGHTDQKTRAHMGVPWLGWGSVGQSPYFSYTPTWTTSHSRATSPSCATSSWSSCWCFTWQSELDQGKA